LNKKPLGLNVDTMRAAARHINWNVCKSSVNPHYITNRPHNILVNRYASS